MNDWLLTRHVPRTSCSNFIFNRGIVVSVFLEGVNKAYELAAELNDTARARCYANFIIESSGHILSLQATNTSEFEKEAIGGFMSSFTNKMMRVDNNQHSVMALMDAYDLGLLK